MSRFASRWAGGDPHKIRAALLMLLCLRGTPVLYQGDEIGLGDVARGPRRLRDPLGVRYWPAYAGRDAMRTPMPWRDGPGRGFTDPGTRPWLPLGPTARRNVEQQRSDPDSMLPGPGPHRAAPPDPDLQTGTYQTRDGTRRGVGLASRDAHRGGAQPERRRRHTPGAPGEIRIGTDRGRDGEAIIDTCRCAAGRAWWPRPVTSRAWRTHASPGSEQVPGAGRPQSWR